MNRSNAQGISGVVFHTVYGSIGNRLVNVASSSLGFVWKWVPHPLVNHHIPHPWTMVPYPRFTKSNDYIIYCNYQYLVGHYPIIYSSSHVFLKFHITTQSNKNPYSTHWNLINGDYFFLCPSIVDNVTGKDSVAVLPMTRGAVDTCCRLNNGRLSKLIPQNEWETTRFAGTTWKRQHGNCNFYVQFSSNFHRIYQMVSYLFLDKSNW